MCIKKDARDSNATFDRLWKYFVAEFEMAKRGGNYSDP